MPKIDFYYSPASPPCRAVRLTAKALGVELRLKEVDTLKKEHLQPYFLKMNPQHTIPTIVDGDLILWESRAILIYLANKCDKEVKLYPEDPKLRAKVNMLLFFDQGTLYQRFANYCFPVLFGSEDSLDPSRKKKLEEALEFLEKFLDGQTSFAAGNNITIADHSLVASVSSIKDSGLIDITPYKLVTEWLDRCESQITEYEELNGKPSKMLGEFITSKIPQKNKAS